MISPRKVRILEFVIEAAVIGMRQMNFASARDYTIFTRLRKFRFSISLANFEDCMISKQKMHDSNTDSLNTRLNPFFFLEAAGNFKNPK